MKKNLIVFFVMITISFALSCSGGGASDSIRVVPTTHIYGTVAVPNYLEYDYTIKNNTSNPLNITSYSFTGANLADFYVSKNGNVPRTISSNSELIITIRFKPSTKGTKTAYLEIKHTMYNFDSLTVKLTGNAITAPAIQLSDSSYDFGSMWIQGKLQKEFTVNSTGTEDLFVSAISITGTNASNFSVITAPTLPVQLVPSSSIKFTVEWTSAAPAAAKSASVVIQHNALGGSSSISLTATSVPYVPLAITTSSINSYGTVWTPYSDDLDYTGGNGNEEFSVKSGDFPKGLDIDKKTGEITGKPAYPGIFQFVIQIDDQISQDDHQYKITVDKKGIWEDVTPNGFSVYGRTAVGSYEFDLYFIGGANNNNGVTDIKVFDTKKNTFGSAGFSLQQPRERAVAACVGDYIYIMGGRTSSLASGTTVGTVEKINAVTKKISTDAYMPNGGQYNTTCGIHNGKIYILGGATPNDTKVYEFTPSSTGNGSWTTKADLTYGYDAMAFVSFNSIMYLIGGDYYGVINEIYEYDPVNGVDMNNPVGGTVQKTAKMQYGFITDSCYLVDNGDNLQKFNFVAMTAHSSNYPDCPMVTSDSYSSQNVECMGRIYITKGDAPSNQIYAYVP